MYMSEAEAAQIFLKYDYAEWKDLCKSFLTLASATLVLSITFSEKIGALQQAAPLVRKAILASWLGLLLSVAFCGAGLVLLSVAANYAAIKQHVPAKAVLIFGQPYSFYSRVATIAIFVAGMAYVSALASMAYAAWHKLGKPAPATEA